MKKLHCCRTLLGVAVVAVASAALAQSGIPPKEDIVDIAAASKDHTTLVTAVKAAELVASLKNPGPLTVFAPTNAAFAKLPAGTVEGLLKPEQKAALGKILQYHVTTSVWQLRHFKDGMKMGQADGSKVVFSVKDGVVKVNDATIIASIRASNGIIHVIDGVLLPPAKK